MRYCALYAPAQPKQGEPLGFIAHVARDFAAPAAVSEVMLLQAPEVSYERFAILALTQSRSARCFSRQSLFRFPTGTQITAEIAWGC